MNEININGSIIKYKKKICGDINFIKELFKGKLYCILLNNFILLCTKNLPLDIFTNKKSIYRTLTNLYATWFFSLYSLYDFTEDNFFPGLSDSSTILYDILYDYCSIKNNINDKDEKINFIVKNNNLKYKEILKKNYEYKDNYFIKINENKFRISKSLYNENRENENILFYRFNLEINFNLNNFRLNRVLNNIIIPKYKYDILKSKYKGFPDELDKLIFLILFRYQIIGSNNNQLAILPKIINKMKNDFKIKFECFASSINSETENYCSLYYDIEKYFGSVGSFFNIEIIEGIYTFNPPYQKDIIERGIKRLFNFLENNNKLTFIITIPIWDNEGKKIMKFKNKQNNNDLIKYKDFGIINEIKSSKFYYGLCMIDKDNFTYLDHNFHLFKNTTIQNTYVIILSNYKNNYIDIIKNYNFK